MRDVMGFPGFLAALFVVLLVTGAVAADKPAADPAKGETAGQTCIPIIQIKQNEFPDDSTIVFRMRGGHDYVNRLPHRCFGLKFERGFSYTTSLDRLCNTDIIHVIHQGGGGAIGSSCGLGLFEPIERDAEVVVSEPENEDGP